MQLSELVELSFTHTAEGKVLESDCKFDFRDTVILLIFSTCMHIYSYQGKSLSLAKVT